MELRQLSYFVAVAEARHFGRAARTLRIAPPSLSQQIRVLERDLGVVLLHRGPRDVRLTPAGAALLEHARALLARAETARRDARSAVPGVARVALRVATGAEAVVGASLRRLAALEPEIAVSVAACPDADGVSALRQERATAAVVWDGAAAGSCGSVADGLGCAELTRVPVTVVLPPGHPLAGPGPVPAAALGDVGVAVLVPDRELAPALWDRLAARLALPPHRLCVVGDGFAPAAAVLRGVVEGRGLAVLPEPMVGAAGPNVTVCPLDPPLDVGLQLLWREPAEAAVHRVLVALGGD
jgi:DNA-binding transcriptional LysR family regulator